MILQKLAENGLSCNVVSGFYHDHLFIEDGKETKVLQILEEMQRKST